MGMRSPEETNDPFREQQTDIAVMAIVDALRMNGYLVLLLDEAGEISRSPKSKEHHEP
jgi:hypothetical protein